MGYELFGIIPDFAWHFVGIIPDFIYVYNGIIPEVLVNLLKKLYFCTQ